ncbi:MAG: single-stranded DNA-binding protein [bacterium]|nr:single-stranded DNA-binding protein [bacterium]
MDLNKAMIIGRLTRDPEVRSTPNGVNVASFGVATNFNWTNQQGQKQEQVEFHNIVVWRKLADIVGQYLKKGAKVYIEGRLQTKSWDGNDGQKKSRTEIVADNMIMLDSKGAAISPSMNSNSQSTPENKPTEEEPTIQVEDSDIPF